MKNNDVIQEALLIAIRFLKPGVNPNLFSSIEETLKSIANVDILPELDVLVATPYDEVQAKLSCLNEKETIRKNKGVYYTPADVVNFIVSNTIKSFAGILSPNNISSTDLLLENADDFCITRKVFDPTCGAGEFLLELFSQKIRLWKKTHQETDQDTIRKIIATIYGNDINPDSTTITKIRLYLHAVNCFGVENCQNLENYLNENFTNYDYVVSPPKNDISFSVICGNPPYVEDSKSGLELRTKYGNIFANVLENSVEHLEKGGAIGFVIPISYCSTPRMQDIRTKLIEFIPEQYILSYADRPDCLFDSVHQKLNIIIGKNKANREPNIYTSCYRYWYQEERTELFETTHVIQNEFIRNDCIPKLSNTTDVSIFRKISNDANPTVFSVSRQGDEVVCLNRREAFWMKAFRTHIDHPEYKIFRYLIPEDADYCYCLLNSSLFWWYWISVSDCWHVSKELNGFRAPINTDLSKASYLAKKLSLKLEETKIYVGTKQTDYEYKHKSCINEIHEVDDFINHLFGLTDEESEYIKNYALKYRLSGGMDEDESN